MKKMPLSLIRAVWRLPEFESAVNVTWEFLKPGIVFRRGGCVYTSKVEGATIKFTKEGVLVKDFEISGKN